LKWQTENSGSDDAESDVTYGLASGSPKTATATAVFSAQLAVQSPELAVAGLFAELADVFAVGIDAAVLGSGGPGAPAGLLSAASIAAGVTVIAAGDPDGGAISYSKLVDQEAAIGASNVPEDPLTTAFIASPTQRQKLRKVAVNGVGSKMCWTVSDDDDSDRLIARRARVTKDCMSGIAKGSGSNLEAVYFGDWSHGMLLMWGGLELIVDRYSLKKQSLVEVTGTAFLEFVLLHGGAFSVIADAA
jgi:HK97 family phage major capsid protein